MGQQELGEVAGVRTGSSALRPSAGTSCVAAEVEVQVQHIEAVLLGLGRGMKKLAPMTVIFTEEAANWTSGGTKRLVILSPTGMAVFHTRRHGSDSTWRRREQSLQVPPVTRPEVLPVPGDVPEARVHDQVRVVLAGLQLLQDILQVVGCARQSKRTRCWPEQNWRTSR